MNYQSSNLMALQSLIAPLNEEFDKIHQDWRHSLGEMLATQSQRFHGIGNVLTLANLSVFAKLAYLLEQATKEFTAGALDDKAGHKILFASKLLHHELNRLVLVGAEQTLLVTLRISYIAELLKDSHSDYQSVLSEALLEDRFSQKIPSPTHPMLGAAEGQTYDFGEQELNKLKLAWHHTINKLMQLNSNDEKELDILANVARYTALGSKTHLFKALWYLTHLWLKSLLLTDTPTPSQYAHLLSELDGIVGADGLEYETLQTALWLENLLADVYVQLGELQVTTDEAHQFLSNLSFKLSNEATFFPYILGILEGMIFSLSQGNLVDGVLPEVKEQLGQRGWSFYESYADQIIQDIHTAKQDPELLMQMQWQISTQLQDLYTAISNTHEAILSKIGEGAGAMASQGATDSQQLRRVRILVENIKRAFNDYLHTKDVSSLPDETMFVELEAIFGGMAMQDASKLNKRIEELFVALASQAPSDISWSFAHTTADGLSLFELFLDGLAKEVYDEALLARAEEQIVKAHSLIGAVGEQVSFEKVEDNKVRYDDTGEIAPVKTAMSPSDEPTSDAVANSVEQQSPSEPDDAVIEEISEAYLSAKAALKPDEFDFDEDIREIFIEEADEVLGEMGELLPVWASRPDNLTPLKDIRRGFHTLKGSGRMVGAFSVGEMAWAVENMLNRVLDGTVPSTPVLAGFVNETAELIPVLVQDFNNKQAPSIDPAITILKAQNILAGKDIEADLPQSTSLSQPSAQENTNEPATALPTIQEVASSDDDLVENEINAQPDDVFGVSEAEEVDLDGDVQAVADIAQEGEDAAAEYVLDDVDTTNEVQLSKSAEIDAQEINAEHTANQDAIAQDVSDQTIIDQNSDIDVITDDAGEVVIDEVDFDDDFEEVAVQDDALNATVDVSADDGWSEEVVIEVSEIDNAVDTFVIDDVVGQEGAATIDSTNQTSDTIVFDDSDDVFAEDGVFDEIVVSETNDVSQGFVELEEQPATITASEDEDFLVEPLSQEQLPNEQSFDEAVVLDDGLSDDVFDFSDDGVADVVVADDDVPPPAPQEEIQEASEVVFDEDDIFDDALTVDATSNAIEEVVVVDDEIIHPSQTLDLDDDIFDEQLTVDTSVSTVQSSVVFDGGDDVVLDDDFDFQEHIQQSENLEVDDGNSDDDIFDDSIIVENDALGVASPKASVVSEEMTEAILGDDDIFDDALTVDAASNATKEMVVTDELVGDADVTAIANDDDAWLSDDQESASDDVEVAIADVDFDDDVFQEVALQEGLNAASDVVLHADDTQEVGDTQIEMSQANDIFVNDENIGTDDAIIDVEINTQSNDVVTFDDDIFADDDVFGDSVAKTTDSNVASQGFVELDDEHLFEDAPKTTDEILVDDEIDVVATESEVVTESDIFGETADGQPSLVEESPAAAQQQMATNLVSADEESVIESDFDEAVFDDALDTSVDVSTQDVAIIEAFDDEMVEVDELFATDLQEDQEELVVDEQVIFDDEIIEDDSQDDTSDPIQDNNGELFFEQSGDVSVSTESVANDEEEIIFDDDPEEDAKDIKEEQLATNDVNVVDETGESNKEEELEQLESLAVDVESVGDIDITTNNQGLPEVLLPFYETAKQPVASQVGEVDEDIKEIYIEEAAEVLETITPLFGEWKTSKDVAQLTDIRRGFHTLKGSGRMVGAVELGELAWSIENMLNRVLDNTVAVDDGMTALIDDVLGDFGGFIGVFENNENTYPETLALYTAVGHAYSKGFGNAFDYRHLNQDNNTSNSNAQSEDLSGESVDKATSETDEVEKPKQVDATTLNLMQEAKVVIDSAEPTTPVNEEEKELCEIFIEEARELLTTVKTFLSENEHQEQVAVSDDVVRVFHTLRGAKGLTPLVAIGEVGSMIESGLQILQRHDEMMSEKHLQALSSSIELIENHLDAYENSHEEALIDSSQEDKELIEDLMRNDEVKSKGNLEVATLIVGIDELLDAELELESKVSKAPEEVSRYAKVILDEIELLEGRTTVSGKFQRLLLSLTGAYRVLHKHPEQASDDALIDAILAGQNELTGLFDSLAGSMSLRLNEQVVGTLDNKVLDVQEFYKNEASTQSLPDEMVQTSNDNLEQDDSSAGRVEVEFVAVDTDPELLDIFLEEAAELDAAIIEAFGQWKADTGNTEALKALQRHLHTIKGGARLADIGSIGDLTHEAETIYERMLNGRLTPSFGWLQVMQGVQDILSLQIEEVRKNKRSFIATEAVSQLQQFLDASEVPEGASILMPLLDDMPKAESAPKAVVQEETSQSVSDFEYHRLRSWHGTLPDNDILAVFLEEVEELVESSAEDFQLFRSNTGDIATLQSLQRKLHTIKGGARMVSANGLADLAHSMETVYEDLGSRRRPATRTITQLLLACHDWMTGALTLLKVVYNPPTPTPLIEALESFSRNPDSLSEVPVVSLADELERIDAHINQAKDQEAGYDISIMPPSSGMFEQSEETANASEMIRISASLMERMVNLSGEAAINRARIDMSMVGLTASIEEMGVTIQRLHDQLRRMDIELEEQILAQIDDEILMSGDFDPLEMDQYSSLNQLSKSLSESASDLLDLKATLIEKTRDGENLLLQLSRTHTDLQDGLMYARMVPFSRLIPRLQRIVRQVSSELGKNVELIAINADDEMDRTILERITSPLEHMLRNAIDHGIETPDERELMAKPKVGQILLEVVREGSEILIHLTDDGAGINVEAVRKKAVSQGLIAANDTSLSDIDIMQYIFNAGLSTTNVVTQISGRGVGMDVVRSEIQQLGGSVSVDSVRGKGSRFTMRVPLTVAVSDTLVVRAADRQYAVPLVQIERVTQLSSKALLEYYQSNNSTIQIEGEPYRLRYLNEILSGHDFGDLVRTGSSGVLPVILVKNQAGQNLALQVDEIIGSRIEVVVKPLGRQLSNVSGISAATIMGDGSVMFILDLMALLRNARARVAVQIKVEEANKRPVILVVDDSVTVRKVTSRFLERQGFEAIVAKDGVDAIEILQDLKPDLMLLDIEMPRMDGFEVATQVRHNARLADLPIIMITSRTGEKHRERAFEIGVSDYMGKPFQENELLERINKYLAG